MSVIKLKHKASKINEADRYPVSHSNPTADDVPSRPNRYPIRPLSIFLCAATAKRTNWEHFNCSLGIFVSR